MAAHVEFSMVASAGTPTYPRAPRAAEKLTTTSSAATTAEAELNDWASVTAIGGDIYVTIGASPTALASGAGMWIVPAGATKNFGPLRAGDKVAAINV